MKRVFEGLIDVDYNQIYVVSGQSVPAVPEAFAGQVNPWCGAAIPGCLVLCTGRQSGDVQLTVETHAESPVVDTSWEDIVEVSFLPSPPAAFLRDWNGRIGVDLELHSAGYRVRWSGSGMDLAYAHEHDPVRPVLDRYLIQLWPSPIAPEVVIKRANRHGYDRVGPPPEVKL